MVFYMTVFIEDLKYVFYILLHPFDGFYEVRFRGRKNYKVAAALIILWGITGILSYQYTGFIINNNPVFAMNSIIIFLTTLFPLILFLVSNWSITTLFNGSGSFGDIFTVISYSIVPKIIFNVLGIVVSNLILQEEAALLYAFMTIGSIWFCFLLFCGLCVIHEYTAMTNIVTLFASAFSAIVIIFLAMLYFTLISKIIGFITTVFTELMKRW